MGAIRDRVDLAHGRAVLLLADALDLLRAGTLPPFDAIVTDPPYGIGFRHSGGGKGGNIPTDSTKQNLAPIVGDDQPFDPCLWIDAAPKTASKNGSIREPRIVLWGADHFRSRLPDGGTLLAWDKHCGIGPDDSFSDCEWAWIGRKTKREVFRYFWKGIVGQKLALDMPPPDVKGWNGFGATRFARVHVSQKPVALMRWCIEKVRPPLDGCVLDPYMGSGTTGIAALSLGYRFVGVEIDETHFRTACRRIEWAWETGLLTDPALEDAPMDKWRDY